LTAVETAGAGAVASAEYRIDDGPYVSLIAADGDFDGTSENVPATIPPFASTGVHTLCVRAADSAGDTGCEVCFFLAVYDPDNGFVTGGGWIVSPAGAYVPAPTLTGKANFGFVSKYQKGQSMPAADTQFRFQAGSFSFKSTSYDWLVISGPQAQYRRSGKINGAGDYGFMLTARDGQASGGGCVDRLRLKVFDKRTGDVIYDNNLGSTDTAAPATALAGGSIVIHK